MANAEGQKKIDEDRNGNSPREFVPPRRSYAIEFWVGLFALAGVACFCYLALNIAGMKISNSGYYRVNAIFTNVAGLKVGAPVEIAGVRIGEVRSVTLADTEALVTMQILNEVKLREDDMPQIRTKGIIGDKYVRISPGGSTEYVEAEGELVDTESAVEFEEIIGKIVHSLTSGDEEEPAAGGEEEPGAASEEPPAENAEAGV